MKNYTGIIIWSVVILVVFAILWRNGQITRLANYIRETREELKKCSWPSWAELKGSTVVVMIAFFLLGLFTIAVDMTSHEVMEVLRKLFG